MILFMTKELFEFDMDGQKLIMKPGALKYENKLSYLFTITTEYLGYIYDQQIILRVQDAPGIPFSVLK